MKKLQTKESIGNPKAPFLLVLLWMATIVCFPCAVEAGESPQGQILPYVLAENDKFAVCYIVTGISGYYQLVYDKNGNRIGAPTEISKEKYPLYDRILKPLKTDPVLPEELRGFVLKSGEDFLVISKQPYFLAKRNGRYVKEDINWGSMAGCVVHDAITVANRVVILVTEIDVTGKWLANDFKVVSVNRETRRIERSLSVGTPGGSAAVPTSSELLYYNGRVFLAWGEPYIDGLRLNLSSWNTTDRYLVKEAISDAVNGNTHLSMAQIHGTVLLAYHNAKDGYHDSVIKTLTVDLRKRFK